MNALHNLQHNFVASVYDDVDNNFDQSIVPHGISGARRLQIYHNNIYISLTKALHSVYPVVNRLVGDDFFKFMAVEYIKKHPSKSGNLHDFGDQFPIFITSFEPANKLVYLGDVARLEWLYHTVFHAADSPEFNLEKLEQIDKKYYDRLVFKPNPASQLFESAFPVLEIWQANQDNQYQDGTEPDVVNINQGGTRLLIIRRGLDVEFQTLELEEYAFLRAIFDGSNFFTACDAAAQDNPECNVGHLLLKHIQTHTIKDCEIRK